MSSHPSRLRLLRTFLLSLTLSACLAAAAAAETLRVRLDGDVAALNDDDEIFLEAYPRRGEGLHAFTRRLTGSVWSAM